MPEATLNTQSESAVFRADRFYTIEQASEVLGVNRSTIHRWEKSGNMPPLHGATRRFRGDYLCKWLDAGVPWRELPEV